MEKTIHKRIERITPHIPSPTAGGSKSNPLNFGVLSAYLCNRSLFKIFPTLSFSFKPKYNPVVINRKKLPAKTEVDTMEF
ncbi:hypothetical protein [Chryseobacterium arthrosphaerae]|uniref:hypothetical protein n=1 Tax=Chryseobacterium arthrosphaerae TaxID=651561 RepID=UPI001E5DC779|nr:hypothetical protein [Chryseobacterium arthrosphaerae]UEQ77505.1 hypothetical protein J8N07_04155 [Chryseobacterium arthrosphaerae]